MRAVNTISVLAYRNFHNNCLHKNRLLFTKNIQQELEIETSNIAKCSIKIGRVFKNQCMLHFRLHFLPDLPKFGLTSFARYCGNKTENVV